MNSKSSNELSKNRLCSQVDQLVKTRLCRPDSLGYQRHSSPTQDTITKGAVEGGVMEPSRKTKKCFC